MRATLHTIGLVIRLSITVLGVLCCFPGASTATTKAVVVIASQINGPYQEVISGIQQTLAQAGESAPPTILSSDGDGTQIPRLLEQVKYSAAGVVVTLGTLATQTVVQANLELPLVATLILNDKDIQHARDATAVVLDFPVTTQFQWLKRFLPHQTAVGVLFNPKANQDFISKVLPEAPHFGMKLITREVNTPQEFPEALASLTRKAEVLWGIADPIALSPQASESLLLSSFHNRIPFIGPSTAWVKAGALYALDRDYRDIGAQCGEVILKILQGSRASDIPPTPPRNIVYAVNLRTAAHMKITMPPELIEGAKQIFR